MVRFVIKMVLVRRGQEALSPAWVESGYVGRSIGRCELIEAGDIQEAVETVRRLYPNFTVMPVALRGSAASKRWHVACAKSPPLESSWDDPPLCGRRTSQRRVLMVQSIFKIVFVK